MKVEAGTEDAGVWMADCTCAMMAISATILR